MTYMEEKFIKRGYYFPPPLLDAWEVFHAPSKDYSPSASGAFLVWMSLGPIARETIRRLAQTPDVGKAVKEVREILSQSLVDTEILAALGSLTPSKKTKLLIDAKKSKGKSGRK